jgi:hypothetical protein
MKFVPTLLLLASLSGVASAATIVQTQNYSYVPNNSQTLTFNKFDTNLGTLLSVTVSVVLNKTGGQFEIDNDSATAGTVDLTHSVVGQLSSPDVSLRKTGAGVVFVGQSGSVTATNSLIGNSVSATTGDNITQFNATNDTDYVKFVPGDSTKSDSGQIRAADQADYESLGASTFDVNFGATQTVNATGLGGLQQAFTVSNVSGNVTVTYNYIPEPASALLGGLGLLTLLRRRRN